MIYVWLATWAGGSLIPEGAAIWLWLATICIPVRLGFAAPILWETLRAYRGGYNLDIDYKKGTIRVPLHRTPQQPVMAQSHRTVALEDCAEFELLTGVNALLPWGLPQEDLLQLRLKDGECIPIVGFRHDPTDPSLSEGWRQLVVWLQARLFTSTITDPQDYPTGTICLPLPYAPVDDSGVPDGKPYEYIERDEYSLFVYYGVLILVAMCALAGVLTESFQSFYRDVKPPPGITNLDAFLKAKSERNIEKIYKANTDDKVYILVHCVPTRILYTFSVSGPGYEFDQSGKLIGWTAIADDDYWMSRYGNNAKAITPEEALRLTVGKEAGTLAP